MMPEQSQYAAAARVPLIKSPSLRVPRPVELPPDIHPLPDSVAPYFVYPFTLETHVLTVGSSRRATRAAHTARREAFLRARDDENERRKKEVLRRIAPGFEPQAAPLIPLKKDAMTHRTTTDAVEHSQHSQTSTNVHTRDVMDDLVDRLAALESDSSRHL